MPITEEPDPLDALLQLSVAEREQAIEALLDSLAAEPNAPSLLKHVRSAVERRLKRLSRGAKDGSGWRSSLSRRPPPRAPPP
jgi:putative addiction module component (TIGR02574 family)